MTDPQEQTEVLCVCGRRLYEPASRALGLGPVCRRAQRPMSETTSDQLALDIPTENGGPDHDVQPLPRLHG